MDGSIASEGRVEVCHGGHWLSVCDRDWERHQAADVCSWLGLGAEGERNEYIISPALMVARDTKGESMYDGSCTDQIPFLFSVLFVDAMAAPTGFFAMGRSPSVISGVNCTGTENSVLECGTVGLEVCDFSKHGQAGVICRGEKQKHLVIVGTSAVM